MIIRYPRHPSHHCQDPDSISWSFLEKFVLVSKGDEDLKVKRIHASARKSSKPGTRVSNGTALMPSWRRKRLSIIQIEKVLSCFVFRPHSPYVVLYKMDNFQMYTLYTLVLTTAKARMFSDQVVNTYSFGFQWQTPYFCWDVQQKIPSEMEVAPRYNCWHCWQYWHCWHCWHCSTLFDVQHCWHDV